MADILTRARQLYMSGKDLPNFSADVDARIAALVAAQTGESGVQEVTSFSVDGQSFSMREDSLETRLAILRAVRNQIDNGAPYTSSTHVRF